MLWDWLDMIIDIKIEKIGGRGFKAAAALIPDCGITTDAFCLAVDAAVETHLQWSYGALFNACAMKLQYRAVSELSGNGSPSASPAFEILVELFTKYGFNRLREGEKANDFVKKLIKEP